MPLGIMGLSGPLESPGPSEGVTMARTAAKTSSGRKPLPANVRLLNGKSEGHDIAGRKVEEPPPFARQPPPKPEGMSPDASRMWDLMVEQMQSVQILKPLDGPGLEVACETYARWKEAVRMRQAVPKPVENWKPDPSSKVPTDLQERPMTDGGLLATNSQGRVTAPWIGIEERAARDFRAWCAEFGLSPAAEKNLIVSDTGSGGLPGGGSNPYK